MHQSTVRMRRGMPEFKSFKASRPLAVLANTDIQAPERMLKSKIYDGLIAF